MPHLVGKGVLESIIESDDSWGLLITELAQNWGEARDRVMAQFQKIHDGGVINIGWANVQDSFIGASGEEVSVGAEYNVTGVPTLLFWPAGPKRLSRPLRLDPQAISSMLSQGGSVHLFNTLKALVPSLIDTVRNTTVYDFLRKEDDSRPRVLLVQNKPDVSPALRALAIAFSSRARFGFAREDATLPAALGLDPSAPFPGTALFYTRPGPFPAPPGAANHAPSAQGMEITQALDRMRMRLEPGCLTDVFTRFEGPLTLANMRAELDRLLPPAPLPLLNSEEAMRERCTESSSATLCVIAFLPGPLRAFSDNGNTDLGAAADGSDTRVSAPAKVLINVTGRAYVTADLASWNGISAVPAARTPLAFAAVDAETEAGAALAAAFGAPTPGIVAYSPRRKVFALHRGSFGVRDVRGFVLDVIDKVWPSTQSSATSSAAFDSPIQLEPLRSPLPALPPRSSLHAPPFSVWTQPRAAAAAKAADPPVTEPAAAAPAAAAGAPGTPGAKRRAPAKGGKRPAPGSKAAAAEPPAPPTPAPAPAVDPSAPVFLADIEAAAEAEAAAQVAAAAAAAAAAKATPPPNLLHIHEARTRRVRSPEEEAELGRDEL